MTWQAAGMLGGAAIGALGNKKKGPSLAQNMSDMYSIFNAANASQAAGGYRNLGPSQYYPGQTYAGLNPQSQAAIQQLIGAGANSPTLNAANQYTQGAAGGQYLNSNPYNSWYQSLASGGLGGYNQTAGTYQNIMGAGGMGGYNAVAPTLQNIQGAGGMGGYNTVAPQLSQMAGWDSAFGGFNRTSPQLSQIATQTGGYDANPSSWGLNYFGSGGELNNNPWLDQMYGAASRSVVDNFRNSVAPSLMSGFSLGGRTAGTNNASQAALGQVSQSLGNTLGDMGANLYGNAYESGRNRQLSALGTQGNLYNTGIQNQLGALGQMDNSYNQGFSNSRGALSDLNSAYNQGIGNRLAATGQTTNAYNAGIGNQLAGAAGLNSAFNSGFGNTMGALNSLSDNYNRERMLQAEASGRAPALNAANITGAQAAVQGAGMLDADAQARIDAEVQRWNAAQANPRAFYSDLAGLYAGIPAANIQGVQPQPYNRLAGALGGGLMGARVGGLFGQGSISDIFGGFGEGSQQQQWGGWSPYSPIGDAQW